MIPTKQNPKNSTRHCEKSTSIYHDSTICNPRFVSRFAEAISVVSRIEDRPARPDRGNEREARGQKRYSSLSGRGCVSRRTPTNEPSHALEEKRRVNLRTAAWNERSRIKPAKWDYFMTARITAMFYSPISRVPHNSTALNSVYLDRLTIDQRAR